MKITTSNKKLGGFIPQLNMPVGITCRPGVPCSIGCYAKRGRFRFEKIKKSILENYLDYKKDPFGFFEEMEKYLNNGDVIYKRFRWFTTGDIPDMQFLNGMAYLAKKCKNTKFLCFTKKHLLVNVWLEFNEKPKNLNIVFSGWDKDFIITNPHNLPISLVKFSKKKLNSPLIENGYNCPGSCTTCRKCWDAKSNDIIVFKKH